MINADAKTEQTWVEHLPALVPAASINAASEQVEVFAKDRWKLSEGWYGHQAVITPVTKEFFDLALDALEAGAIDEGDAETEQTFQF